MPGVTKSSRTATVFVDAEGHEHMEAGSAIRANLSLALSRAAMNGMVSDQLTVEQAEQGIAALSIFVHDMRTPVKDIPNV